MQRCRCNDNEIYITAISPPPPLFSPSFEKNNNFKFVQLDLIQLSFHHLSVYWSWFLCCLAFISTLLPFNYFFIIFLIIIIFYSNCKVIATYASISLRMDCNVVLFHHLDGYMNSKYMKTFVHVSSNNICVYQLTHTLFLPALIVEAKLRRSWRVHAIPERLDRPK